MSKQQVCSSCGKRFTAYGDEEGDYCPSCGSGWSHDPTKRDEEKEAEEWYWKCRD